MFFYFITIFQCDRLRYFLVVSDVMKLTKISGFSLFVIPTKRIFGIFYDIGCILLKLFFLLNPDFLKNLSLIMLNLLF